MEHLSIVKKKHLCIHIISYVSIDLWENSILGGSSIKRQIEQLITYNFKFMLHSSQDINRDTTGYKWIMEMETVSLLSIKR